MPLFLLDRENRSLEFGDMTNPPTQTYHITIDGVDYSVPHRLIGCSVIMRTSRSLIEAFHDGKPVAMHQRRWEHGSVATDPAHMPPGHCAWRAKETADLELWARDRGEAVQAIMAVEAALGYTGRVKDLQFEMIDGLARKFGRDAFELACTRACAVGDLTIAHVRNLLNANRQGGPIRQPHRRTSTVPTSNVRGASYYAGEA